MDFALVDFFIAPNVLCTDYDHCQMLTTLNSGYFTNNTQPLMSHKLLVNCHVA